MEFLSSFVSSSLQSFILLLDRRHLVAASVAVDIDDCNCVSLETNYLWLNSWVNASPNKEYHGFSCANAEPLHEQYKEKVITVEASPAIFEKIPLIQPMFDTA